MQLDAKTTWWLTFALVAIQGLNTIAWATLGLDAHYVAAIGQGTGYLTLLLTFAIHGSIPGIAPVQMPKSLIFLAVALGALVLAGGSAHAQTRKPSLTGDPVRDIGNAVSQGKQQAPGNPLDALAKKIAALSLADFKYAAALAHATGNNVTAPCWDEWVKLISAQQQPLTDPATGQPMTEPDPHLATDMERLSEAIHQLQPNSELSVACAPMASAVQKDAATLISGVLSGGALGLFKLPIPIGVVP